MTISDGILYLITQFINHFCNGPLKCKRCKLPLQPFSERQLFLLPVHHDATYKPSPEFFVHNLEPIDTLLDIPTGRRACYMDYYKCPKCGKEIVTLIDFLYVREKTLIIDTYTYDYVLLKEAATK